MAIVFTPTDKQSVENRRSKQVAPANGPQDHGILDRSPWPSVSRCEKKHNASPSKGRTEHARAC